MTDCGMRVKLAEFPAWGKAKYNYMVPDCYRGIGQWGVPAGGGLGPPREREILREGRGLGRQEVAFCIFVGSMIDKY